MSQSESVTWNHKCKLPWVAEAHQLYGITGFRVIEAYEGSEISLEFQNHWIFMEMELARKKVDAD